MQSLMGHSDVSSGDKRVEGKGSGGLAAEGGHRKGYHGYRETSNSAPSQEKSAFRANNWAPEDSIHKNTKAFERRESTTEGFLRGKTTT